MVRLAAWLGLTNPSFEAVMDWVLQLRKEIEIPHTLSDRGVGKDRLDELSEMAAVDPTAAGNPIPAGPPEMKAMFINAIEGRL